MSNNILFVFEGEKTEKQISNNLAEYFLDDRVAIQFAYCGDIYQLYREIDADEDLDTFVLLQQRTANITDLSDFDRDDFAEIYLFFDYDGHATGADDENLRKLIDLFDQETEAGKLLVSYPMVESIKHLSKDIEFKNLKVEAKDKVGYKKMVGAECDNRFQNLTAWTKHEWLEAIEAHLCKANYIVNDDFVSPTILLLQMEIFIHQLKKYIEVDSTVAVLSGFPLFLQGYYGAEGINEMLTE
ncbi:MAG: hypothetical protein GC178_18255 [Flavobacteriales bacterium]|nr:hypothetical protein [Flavobacteriales bacterium]